MSKETHPLWMERFRLKVKQVSCRLNPDLIHKNLATLLLVCSRAPSSMMGKYCSQITSNKTHPLWMKWFDLKKQSPCQLNPNLFHNNPCVLNLGHLVASLEPRVDLGIFDWMVRPKCDVFYYLYLFFEFLYSKYNIWWIKYVILDYN